MAQKKWEIHNPAGSKRVIVTKELPGLEQTGYFALFR